MAKVNVTLCLLTFLLVIAYCSCSRLPFDGHNQKQVANWCVARASALADKLQGFLNYACSKYDCKEIQPGGSCFDPDNLFSHASYALDLNFRNTGDCPLDIALPAATDPSFGGCHYP